MVLIKSKYLRKDTEMISSTKNPNGSVTLTALVGGTYGYYKSQTYYGYTLKEAKQLFRELLKTL